LDPYNDFQPKAGVKFDITAAEEKPKADFYTKDEFKKLHDLTKFMSQD
jgi:hypothetical protein